MVCRVQAESHAQAVARLKAALEFLEQLGAGSCDIFNDLHDDNSDRPGRGIEYISICFNKDAVTEATIDEVNEVTEEYLIDDDQTWPIDDIERQQGSTS